MALRWDIPTEHAMPKIEIRRPHQLSIAEARAVVDQVAARMHEKFGMDGRWQDDTLLFSRPGVSGSIAVGGDAIQVKAELGLMLTPLKGMIEQEIRRKLDEHFA
jgi:putative polyhydroxyalkanoate system protein